MDWFLHRSGLQAKEQGTAPTVMMGIARTPRNGAAVLDCLHQGFPAWE